MSNLVPITVASGSGPSSKQTVALLNCMHTLETVKSENLRTLGGKPGCTLAQGQ